MNSWFSSPIRLVPQGLGHTLDHLSQDRTGGRKVEAYISLPTLAENTAVGKRDLAVALTNTGKPMPSIDTIRWFEILRQINTRVPRDGSGPLRHLR